MKKRQVVFEYRSLPKSCDVDTTYIYVVFMDENHREVSSQFAPFKMNCERAIIDWLLYGKITVVEEG